MNNKWAPFSSVIDGNILIKELEKERKKVNKPILSDEQIKDLETLILESFNNQTKLEFKIYFKGYFYNIKGIIIKINITKKQIMLDNKKIVNFDNIIEIYNLPF